nr:chemosensory protein protein 19 [Diaphania glauculalis]
MKTFSAICFLALAAVVSAYPRAKDSKYTDRYDSVNLEEVISNRRLLVPYIKCILEQGKCSPEGRELRSHIKEALENYCAKCTDTQRSGTRRVIGHLINNEAAYWTQLSAKYDPDRKFVTKYEKELRTVKV